MESLQNLRALDLQVWIEYFSPDELRVDGVEHYLDFLREAQFRYDPSRYSEWHHVIPKCIDKDKKYRDQGLFINARDHVLAHKALLDCFTSCANRRKLGYALHMMLRDPTGQRVESLSPEEYEDIRNLWSDSVVGIKRSVETCQKLSKVLGDGRLAGEKHPNYGKHVSKETSEKISKGIKAAWTPEKRTKFSESRKGAGNPCFGKKLPSRRMSPESCQKMSKSGKGKIWINNGIQSTKISQEDPIPEGWERGRLYTPDPKFLHSAKGKIWITNGEMNRKISQEDLVPEGWRRGKVHYKHEN